MNYGTYIELDGIVTVTEKPKPAKPDINVLSRFRARGIYHGVILAPVAKNRSQVKEWAENAGLDASLMNLLSLTDKFTVNGEVKTVKELIETYCKDTRETYFVEVE